MVGLEEEIIDKDFRQSYWLALQFSVQPNQIFVALPRKNNFRSNFLLCFVNASGSQRGCLCPKYFKNRSWSRGFRKFTVRFRPIRKEIVSEIRHTDISLSRNKKVNWEPSSGRLAKKMKCCNRLIHKQFVQVSCLCGPQFLSYLPKRFTHLCRALWVDVVLVYRFGAPIWPPEISKNIWSSLFL